MKFRYRVSTARYQHPLYTRDDQLTETSDLHRAHILFMHGVVFWFSQLSLLYPTGLRARKKVPQRRCGWIIRCCADEIREAKTATVNFWLLRHFLSCLGKLGGTRWISLYNHLCSGRAGRSASPLSIGHLYPRHLPLVHHLLFGNQISNTPQNASSFEKILDIRNRP